MHITEGKEAKMPKIFRKVLGWASICCWIFMFIWQAVVLYKEPLTIYLMVMVATATFYALIIALIHQMMNNKL